MCRVDCGVIVCHLMLQISEKVSNMTSDFGLNDARLLRQYLLDLYLNDKEGMCTIE